MRRKKGFNGRYAISIQSLSHGSTVGTHQYSLEKKIRFITQSFFALEKVTGISVVSGTHLVALTNNNREYSISLCYPPRLF